jgi:hypothetical protein
MGRQKYLATLAGLKFRLVINASPRGYEPCRPAGDYSITVAAVTGIPPHAVTSYAATFVESFAVDRLGRHTPHPHAASCP